MNSIANDRSLVLEMAGRTAEALHRRGDGKEVAGLDAITPQAASLLARDLWRARDWALSDAGEREEADELVGDDDYVSHDPTLSLVQAALDEFGDDHPHAKAASIGTSDALLRTIANTLSLRTKNQLPFIPPTSPDSDVFDLADRCTVVLVGDWGTAKDRARRVARQIAARTPDHIIHLGDIYPSGTRSRAQTRFIDVWKKEVGLAPKYWAMNGNHEMNAAGEGYFLDVLPFCGQRASFFCLRNAHWKLIALDTAYVDHDLHPAQMDWLKHQLSTGSGKNILLSHHQMFSAIDTRPSENRKKLPATMKPVVDTGQIFAWFWGHEHRCLSYAREAKWGNYHARAIGHGGKRIRMNHGFHLGPDFAPEVVHFWDVPRPNNPERAMNGFAVLTFDGASVSVEIVDETGTAWVTEEWPNHPQT